MPRYYVFHNALAKGPYTVEQLVHIRLPADRLVCREGEAEWRAAYDEPELGPKLLAVAPAPPPPPPAAILRSMAIENAAGPAPGKRTAVLEPERTVQTSPPTPSQPPPPLPTATPPDSKPVVNARRNCMTMAILAALTPVLVFVGGGVISLAVGIFAAVYLPLRWRTIMQLPSKYRLCGLIGGSVLILVLVVQILLFLVLVAVGPNPAP